MKLVVPRDGNILLLIIRLSPDYAYIRIEKHERQ